MSDPLPNFFIVGPPKTGTTSLYHYLDQHPDIYLSPIKEPCFFAPEVIATEGSRAYVRAEAAGISAYIRGPMTVKHAGGMVLDWDEYRMLFRFAGGASAIGEATVYYLASEHAPAAIAARFPHARIIVVLRDPAERAVAFWNAQRARKATGLGFVAWFRERVAEEQGRTLPHFPLWSANYATHLRRWFTHFPREQVTLVQFAELARDPNSVVRQLCTTLGVDPDVPLNTGRRHNVTRVPRVSALVGLPAPVRRALAGVTPASIRRWFWTRRPVHVEHGERAVAEAHYAQEMDELVELLGPDQRPTRAHM